MASLPAFHSFHQAVVYDQHGGSDDSKIQLMPHVGTHASSNDSFPAVQSPKQAESQVASNLDASHGSQSLSSGHSTQKAEDPIVSALENSGDGSLDGMPIHIAQGDKAHPNGAHAIADANTLDVQSTQAARVVHDDEDDSISNTLVSHQVQIQTRDTSAPAPDDVLEDSEAQAYQRLAVRVKNKVNSTRDAINDGEHDTPSVQPPQVPEVPVKNIVVNGDGQGPRASAGVGSEPSSAEAPLQTKTISEPLNYDDPATIQALQHSFNLKVIHQNSERLESESRPVPGIPAVSINIMSSMSFIAVRIACFLLLSAVAPAVLAIILNLAFAYSKPVNMSFSTVFGISALVVITSILFLVASSMHTIIKNNKAAKFDKKALRDFSKLAAASYLFVLGSGGHTTELISLVKLSQKPYRHTHRRYLITAGDDHSRHQANMLEDKMASSRPDGSAGTSDIVTVIRARAVHQSYITSIFTSLKCFFEIADALVNIPCARVGQPGAEGFRSPHVIVTNGPGTGFIVGLVAFFLKAFYVVPRDRLKIVFVETWARTHSLGLTGKLFYLTQIADLFVVQSEELAEAINKPSIGNLNKRWADLVNAASEGGHDVNQGAE